jgi:hypothetical protein
MIHFRAASDGQVDGDVSQFPLSLVVRAGNLRENLCEQFRRTGVQVVSLGAHLAEFLYREDPRNDCTNCHLSA